MGSCTIIDDDKPSSKSKSNSSDSLAPGSYDGYTIANDGSISHNEGNMYGSMTKTNTFDDSKSNSTMDDEKKNEIQSISIQNANQLRDIGCVIIKNGIRKDLISNALKLINNA